MFREVNTKATRPDEVLDPAQQQRIISFGGVFRLRIDFVNYDDATIMVLSQGRGIIKMRQITKHRDHRDCLSA